TSFAASTAVCSDGFRTTVFPVATAALIIPVNMASGKFHGAMTIPTPRGHHDWKFDSPGTIWVRFGRASSLLAAALKLQKSIASATSASDSLHVLPASNTISAVIRLLSLRSKSPSLVSNRARFSAGVRAHPGCAEHADSSAASASETHPRAEYPTTS